MSEFCPLCKQLVEIGGEGKDKGATHFYIGKAFDEGKMQGRLQTLRDLKEMFIKEKYEYFFLSQRVIDEILEKMRLEYGL